MWDLITLDALNRRSPRERALLDYQLKKYLEILHASLPADLYQKVVAELRKTMD